MKNCVSLVAFFLCVGACLHAMEEKTPLLGQKNNGLTEETFGSIHEQLQSTASVENNEHTKTEPSLIDEIIAENNQTFCSPSYNDLCHPKKLVIKTALTLCLAGLWDGGISGSIAAINACCGSPAAIVCSASFQSIVAPIACGLCWCRHCATLSLVLDHDNHNSSHNEWVRKQRWVI